MFFNFLNELYYTYKFSNHIKRVFNNGNKKPTKKIILIETSRLYVSHVGYAYLCNKLREKYSSKIYMIKTNFFNNGVEKILHLLALKMNLLHLTEESQRFQRLSLKKKSKFELEQFQVFFFFSHFAKNKTLVKKKNLVR